MKQKFVLLSFIVFCLISSVSAQPKKNSWSIGGSGYWIKIKSNSGDYRSIYNLAVDGQYFIFRNFAVGTEVEYIGGRALDTPNKPRYHELYVSPTIEGYLFNRPKWGLSVKGLISLNASIKSSMDPDNLLSYYMFGPKVSYNITPNLSCYTWFAYRRLPDDITNNYPGRSVAYPSDNYDLRFGFTYYLHPKKE
ncbi:MAG TPA: hypothetical protein VJ919_08245 [Tangfeifania sp.]|nr:hypothetical protein [Tangfeifania sp.]